MHASLPPELLLKIVGYLPGAALKQWCSANSNFLSLGRPKLFSIIPLPTYRPDLDSTPLLTGRGKELVLQYTRGMVIYPQWKGFFGRRKGGVRRTEMLLLFIEELGKNLRFLRISDWDYMEWSKFNPVLRDGLFQHVVPHVQVLDIHGIEDISLSTIVKSAHSIRHLHLKGYSFAEEEMGKLGSGIFPNLQKLTIAFTY
ncbi:hypothetical protein DL96DRAFT_1004716 [Flagelloscypha sp. PMI_526]|nr:hypothetical protein DL96DRAFT_1004716 [Flagelloscypha sp. PMI_526]